MDPEIKARWVAALRSGEYKQGRGYLHQRTPEGDRFCCLGVLCHLAAAEMPEIAVVPPYPHKISASYDCEEGVLPYSVMSWAGLEDADPDVERGAGRATLSVLNDDGASFEEIADLIEGQP